jgi:hypothetical protein
LFAIVVIFRSTGLHEASGVSVICPFHFKYAEDFGVEGVPFPFQIYFSLDEDFGAC